MKANAYPLATVANNADTLLGVQGGGMVQFPRSLLNTFSGPVTINNGLVGSFAIDSSGNLTQTGSFTVVASDGAIQMDSTTVNICTISGANIDIGTANVSGTGGGDVHMGTGAGWDVQVGSLSNSLVLNSPRILVAPLPTADPHEVGRLWNSAGTLKVSAG
jgi:hypothetical protein